MPFYCHCLRKKQRQLHREEKNVKTLEKKQARTVYELKTVLEQTKEKISRRQEWLDKLEQLLTEEEEVLKELETDYKKLFRQALDITTKQRERISRQRVDLQEKKADIEANSSLYFNSSYETYGAEYSPQVNGIHGEPEMKVHWFQFPNKKVEF